MLLGLKPGLGLGPFALGSPLPEVLTYLQLHKPDWRCVEVKYADKDTLARDVLVGFPEHGFQLHFEPHCQRLRLVEVFDVTRLQMMYGRTMVFGGASHAPTFGRIYEAFGPTYPGEPESEGVALQYPGIMFLFPAGPAAQRQQGHAVPAAVPTGFGGAEGGGGRGAPSFPVPLSVVADRIYVHGGTRGPPAAVLTAPPPALEPGSQYMEPLEAVPSHGIYLGLGCSIGVHFGDCPQDVVSQLGQPARVVPKRAGVGSGASAVPDYFYGYPSRGLDLLFCGASHRLKKVVLHTNIPGHPDFNLYCKCNFSVHHWDWRPTRQQEAPGSRQSQAWPGLGSSGGSASEDGSGVPAFGMPGSVIGLPSWDASVGNGFAEVHPSHAASTTPVDAGGTELLCVADTVPQQLAFNVATQPAKVAGQPGQSPRKPPLQQQALGQQGQQQPLPVRQQQQQRRQAQTQQQQGQQGLPQVQRQLNQGQEGEQQEDAAGVEEDRSPGGFSQLVGQLAGFLGDVITLDPQKMSEGQQGDAPVAGVPQGQGSVTSSPPTGARKTAGEEAVATAAATKAGASAAAAPSGGKPPKPPTLAAAPALPAVATSKAGKKKKGKKKKAQAAAAGAAGAEAQEDSDSLADASASDSGFDSSLASSPATSSPFPSHMPPVRHRLGLASGYQSSDWGSTADLAGKEGSVGVGSAMDGWSDADDLLAMVAGPSPGPGSPLVKAARAAAAGAHSQVEPLELDKGGPGIAGKVAAGPADGRQQQQQEQQVAEEDGGVVFEGADASLAAWALPSASLAALHQGAGVGAASALTAALSGSPSTAGGTAGNMAGGARAVAAAGVQTVDTAVGEDAPSGALGGGEGAGELPPLAELEEVAACWEDSGSPQGYYVIPDEPSLFDERAGAAEYERVPRQRDCSTQTPTHLLAATPGSGGHGPGRTAGGGTTSGNSGGSGCFGGPAPRAVVTADSRLEEIEAAFGHLGGPALHSRLGCSHPFGPTYLYAYRGVVFEVLQNGLIATVTLFQP